MLPITIRRAVLAAAVLGLALGGVGQARAGLVVVPNAYAMEEGNSSDRFPFNIGAGAIPLSSQRYQQVYSSSEFSSLGGPAEITQIRFRPAETTNGGGAFNSTLPQIQIDLSTTSVTPATLSTTFANNVVANETVVFNKGPLLLSSSDTGPPEGPKAFDIVINLTTPFLYDPTKGNLLMDVWNFQGGTTTWFDATSTSSDATSTSLVTQRVFSTDVNSPTGVTAGQTNGLVTEFEFSPALAAVPESSTLLGGVAGALLCLIYHRRRH